MGRIRSFLKWATRSHRRRSKPRQGTLGLSRYQRRLRMESLEVRTLLSVAPLNVALISDAVAQAQQVRAAAATGTIAIVYHADTMTTAGLVNLLASVSAEHGGDPIANLAIVAHGASGEIDLGKSDDLTLASLAGQAAALERLRSVFASDACLDVYSCDVAAGASGKTFVNELAGVTGATVYASDNRVGNVPGADLHLDYHAGNVVASTDLFSVREIEAIPALCLLSMNTTYYNSPNNLDAADANVGQCTWYVYGRIQETGLITAAKLSSTLNAAGVPIFEGSANTWYSDATSSGAKAAGFTTGATSKPDAIAYWNTGGNNHVAFVEDSYADVTESNNTPASASSIPADGGQVVIDGYVGYPYVKLHQSADATSTTLWAIPQFTVMYVTGSPQNAGGYQWFPLSAEDGNSNHTGWAALLDANTGLAATNNFIWNFTGIQLSPGAAWLGTPSGYIYLPSQDPAQTVSISARTAGSRSQRHQSRSAERRGTQVGRACRT